MLKHYKYFIPVILLLLNIISINSKSPVRLKDIAVIEGIRENQIMGFGLVTGLRGNGDSKSFKLTQKMLLNLALNHGFNIDETDINSKNIAAVLVTSTISSFSSSGDKVDVQLSSIGDAKSLEGGILLQTPLKASNNIVYGIAQGRIISGNSEHGTQNTATIPDGAILEKNITSNFVNNNILNINLKYPDFITASQVKEAVKGLNNEITVTAVDPGKIQLILTDDIANDVVDFIAQLEILPIIPDYVSAVVIDKKTGIIVIGEDIIIQQCSISTPYAQIKVGSNNIEMGAQTVGELVKLLNESGLQTNEIISILESINKMGAINAKFIIL